MAEAQDGAKLAGTIKTAGSQGLQFNENGKSMRDVKRLSFASVTMCALTVAGAHAQADNYYSRDKYTAVLDRSQPEFDPAPVRLGTFVVRPSAEAGVSYTDNVLASDQDKESGTIATGALLARGDTDWSVHSIGFDVSARRSEYLDQSSESYNDLRARVRGRLDVTRAISIGAAAYAEDRVEPRTDFSSAFSPDAPIEFTVQGAEGYINYQNDRVRWTNNVGVRKEDYENATQIGTGLPIDQGFRDNTQTTATSRLAYAVSPDLAVFGQGTYRVRDYDEQQDFGGILRSRDSKGYTAAVGVDFELTSLVRGEIAIGYLNETKDDSFFEDVSGLSVDGRLLWFPSQLTTVTFTGGRSVTDTGVFDSPTAIYSRVGARVDHELRRNIILSATAEYSDYSYEEIDRSDELVSLGLQATYKMSPRVHFNTFVERDDRDVSGTSVLGAPAFGVTTVGVGVRLFP